jgi:hypothetical protein
MDNWLMNKTVSSHVPIYTTQKMRAKIFYLYRLRVDLAYVSLFLLVYACETTILSLLKIRRLHLWRNSSFSS